MTEEKIFNLFTASEVQELRTSSICVEVEIMERRRRPFHDV